eukprot:gnl/MRDRNA2_/MRDRNA2_177883_c0_seq1.p1 gnl/MRDRNA2_/MRDRNA2_177883_c0~~gnl/MRDRNA2_/MRDRNA2_177883_c0_seq1.p1  ORF type:complete len:287 (+),score=48.31 gnl/MRDRNA2_/MRDRNA2_177883_c0_seq1:80-940(+)
MHREPVDMGTNNDDVFWGKHANDGWVVKNTFLELPEEQLQRDGLQRSNSTSQLSTLSLSSTGVPTLRELRDWSSKSSSTHSVSGSHCSSPHDGVLDLGPCHDAGDCPSKLDPPTLVAEELYRKLKAIGGSRNASAERLAAEESVHEARQHVPRDTKGNLTSIGSIMHSKEPFATQCRPCIFWNKGRCSKGEVCLHCHFRHPNVEGKKLRASKGTRIRRAKLLQNAQDLEQSELQDKAGVEQLQGDLTTASSIGSAADSRSNVSNDSGAVTKLSSKTIFKPATRVSL